ncbi:uncharacterized protein LOC134267946 [Saccostrea cucullata]|uniref:uncharacterized protein LOC134267946 n=1 Tax=Saccostrea cuccullata TaxID=36930 RepID=UPI002ED1424D
MKVVLLLVFALLCSSGQVEADVDLVKEGRLLKALFEGNLFDDECVCTKNSCSCCKYIMWISSKREKVCGDLAYTSQTKQFLLNLSADNTTIMSSPVTVQNPKACKDLSAYIRVCLEVAEIKIESTDISGCLKLTLFMLQKINFRLGCFRMPYFAEKKLLFWGNNWN